MRAFVLGLLATSLVLSFAPADADAQRWRPGRGAHLSGWFTIVSEGGLCLDLHGAGAGRDRGRVRMWTCHGGANQLWRFERGRLVSAAGGCLEAHPRDLARRARGRRLVRLRARGCRRAPDQQWRIDPQGSTLVNVAGGCLDVEAGAIHRVGQRAITWPCHGRANQRFQLSPVVQHRPPPRPPLARARRAMDDAAFAAFLQRVRDASFSSDRVGVVRATAPHAWMTAAQIRGVLAAMSFSSERVAVLELLVPRMVDRQNGAEILAALSFSSERERAQQLLARPRPHTRPR